MKRGIASMLAHLALLIGLLLTLFPLVWMVSVSFMPAMESTRFPPRLLPQTPTLEHYQSLFTQLNLARYLLNSTLLASAITLISLLLNSLAGYAFAKLEFAGRERLFKLLLAAMVIPGQVTMLP